MVRVNDPEGSRRQLLLRQRGGATAVIDTGDLDQFVSGRAERLVSEGCQFWAA